MDVDVGVAGVGGGRCARAKLGGSATITSNASGSNVASRRRGTATGGGVRTIIVVVVVFIVIMVNDSTGSDVV